MPRQVDHEGRRRLIAEAVCRLADERGLEGVTLRDVAARAQVSMGAVQRCFSTKDEMLVFTLEQVGERIGERVRARVVRAPAQSAASALGHAATEVALLDPAHRAEARVWLAFVAQAAVSPGLARPLRTNYAALEEMFTRLIAEGGADADSGAADDADSDVDEGSHVDPRREARALLALADGLTAHVLIDRLTLDEALDVLDAHLGALWQRTAGPSSRPGPGRGHGGHGGGARSTADGGGSRRAPEHRAP